MSFSTWHQRHITEVYVKYLLLTFSYTKRVVRSWESFFVYSLDITSSVLWSYFILFITPYSESSFITFEPVSFGDNVWELLRKVVWPPYFNQIASYPCDLVTINKGFCDKNRNYLEREKTYHFIQPISDWLALNSNHKHCMQSVFIVRIGTFWHAMKQELCRSVNHKWRRKD